MKSKRPAISLEYNYSPLTKICLTYTYKYSIDGGPGRASLRGAGHAGVPADGGGLAHAGQPRLRQRPRRRRRAQADAQG